MASGRISYRTTTKRNKERYCEQQRSRSNDDLLVK